MIDHLFPFYERELRYVNLLTQEFSRRHPGAAKRLGIEATGSSDPTTCKRLLETSSLCWPGSALTPRSTMNIPS